MEIKKCVQVSSVFDCEKTALIIYKDTAGVLCLARNNVLKIGASPSAKVELCQNLAVCVA